jgi:predicted DNA binding CopG/RHH family protein
MKKKILYTDEPPNVDLDNAKRVEDFLPPPKELTLKKSRVVTLRFNESVLFQLKKVAEQKGLGVSGLIRMWVLEQMDKTQPHA